MTWTGNCPLDELQRRSKCSSRIVWTWGLDASRLASMSYHLWYVACESRIQDVFHLQIQTWTCLFEKQIAMYPNAAKGEAILSERH